MPEPLLRLRVYAIEVQAVQHCNLSCVGCAQGSPGQLSGYEDPAILERTLSNLKPYLECRKVQVLGGEPLLHPRLEEILSVAAQSRVAEKVTVKTNGLLLLQASPRFWALVDEVIVSVYPGTKRAIERTRRRLEQTASSHGVVLVFRIFDRFQEIIGRSNVNLISTDEIYERCQFKVYTHSIRDGRLYRCAPSVNVLRDAHCSNDADSLDVLNSDNLRDRLHSFLSSPHPLQCCSGCMGSEGASFTHSMRRTRPAYAA